MDTLGVALIGSGYIAHYHARGLRAQPGVQMRALCSLDGPDAQAFAQTYGIPEVTESINDLLGRADIQAAIICTPNRFHAPYALEFMRHAQDVFVEKPMAISAVQGQEMHQCARDEQRILMVGHMWRFDTEVDYVRKLVQAGTLGDIVKTKGYGIHVNWGPEGWFVQKELAGGGALADMGVHAIDAVRYILGDPRPIRVYAQISTAFGDYDVDDTGLVLITWETGTVSVIESGWWHTHADGPEASTQVFGTQGYARCFPTLHKRKAGEEMEEIVPDMPERKEHCDQVIYTRQMEHFIQCLRTRQDPIPGADHGQVVLRIVDAAYKSAQTGQAMEIEWVQPA